MVKLFAGNSLLAFWRKFSPWLLAFSWFLGMILGILAASAASEALIPMMYQSVQCSVSSPGLLVAAVVPFLLSAFAVSLSKPQLLLIVSLLKAFSYGYCACGISLTFGQSSWLVRLLFLFSDHILIPMLYLYWVRHIQGCTDRRLSELWCFIAFALLVAGIDCYFVAPFLVTLI